MLSQPALPKTSEELPPRPHPRAAGFLLTQAVSTACVGAEGCTTSASWPPLFARGAQLGSVSSVPQRCTPTIRNFSLNKLHMARH